MNTQLIDAIRQLNLKPGESLTVLVDGRTVEIRDRDAAEPAAYAGQVMMLPWFESPDPAGGRALARPGKLPPPDPVIIPNDEEGAP